MHLERYKEALVAFERSISLNPNYHRAHYYKATALRALGRNEEAQAAYTRAQNLIG